MKSISILGSGWLGLPLAQHFVSLGHLVKASTRSKIRTADLESVGADPFIVDIDGLKNNIQRFLQAAILIVSIPSKNLAGFRRLIEAIEHSEIENVLFVSSTSVYEDSNTTIMESDAGFFSQSPLLDIESQFKHGAGFTTTIVRFGGLIGYNRQPGRFFGSAGIVRNPESPVNLIHRDDCIGIISRIVEKEAWGEVFNCCADTHPTKRAFYTRAAKSIDCVVPEFADSDSMSFKIISNQKVKKSLNYEFMHPDLMKIEFNESTK